MTLQSFPVIPTIKNGAEKTFAVSLLQKGDAILKILNPSLSQSIMSHADTQTNTCCIALNSFSCCFALGFVLCTE